MKFSLYKNPPSSVFCAAPGRRRFGALVLSSAALGFAGCSTVMPSLMDGYTVPVSEIAEKLATEFPLKKTYLGLFNVSLLSPSVKMLPSSKRIGTHFGFQAGTSVLGGGSFAGTLDLSYGVRYEATDNSIRLTEVRLDDIKTRQGYSFMDRPLVELGNAIAKNLLRDYTVYRIPENKLSWGKQLGLQIQDVQVGEQGLVFKFQK